MAAEKKVQLIVNAKGHLAGETMTLATANKLGITEGQCREWTGNKDGTVGQANHRAIESPVDKK